MEEEVDYADREGDNKHDGRPCALVVLPYSPSERAHMKGLPAPFGVSSSCWP